MRKHRIALLDMNNGHTNRGIACLEQILSMHAPANVIVRKFSVRDKCELPKRANDFDVYISSGGPGSPFDGEGLKWEARLFSLLEELIHSNKTAPPQKKQFFFGICHSFQLLARYFKIAEVCERPKPSLGIVPIYRTDKKSANSFLGGLTNPFYAFDSRHWQVIQPDRARIEELGSELLAFDSPDLQHPKTAVTAIRFTPEVEGVQFHPEAEPGAIFELFEDGIDEQSILRDPSLLIPVYNRILPSFLKRSIGQ